MVNRRRYCIICYKIKKSEYAKRHYEKRKEHIKLKSKKYQRENKEKTTNRIKNWIENNKEKHYEYCEKWRLKNIEKVNKYQKERYEQKKEHIISVSVCYQKNRYKQDIGYKMRKNINAIVLSSFKRALKGSLIKKSKSLDILGCDIEFFIKYISQK